MRATYLTAQQLSAALQRLDGTHVPVRTLAAWAATGVCRPSVDWTHKRRAPRLYAMRDLSRARLVVQLRAAGMSMLKVRAVLTHLDAQDRDAFSYSAKSTLVVDGWRVTLHAPGQPGRTPDGQFVLPLEACITGNLEAARAVRRVA